MRFRPARAPGGNVCPAEDTGDDGNFAVMQEGAAVLDAGSGMTLEDPFILKNPTREAPGIFVGMPVAGATSDTLRVTGGEAVNGNRYYCVVQDQVGQKIVSAEALLTLELPLPPATGDGFPLWPALALAVLSGTSLLIIIIKKRHNM
mgnify:CR=1 FL=1